MGGGARPVNVSGPHVSPIRLTEEQGDDVPSIIGIWERCDGCRTRRKPGHDPLWPLVPILSRRARRLALIGFCPRCAGKLVAYMLLTRQPWIEWGLPLHLALGMTR
jgi:hypothetical protein